MKTAKSITIIVLGIFAAIWFIIADHTTWWLAILLVPASVGCFYWLDGLGTRTWVRVLIMVAGFFAIRFIALPFLAFVLLVGIGAIFAGIGAIGWGFKTLGIGGGLVFGIIVVLILKKIFS